MPQLLMTQPAGANPPDLRLRFSISSGREPSASQIALTVTGLTDDRGRMVLSRLPRRAPQPPHRGSSRPLSWREQCLLCIAGLELVLLPWAFGGTLAWAQFVALTLSVGALAVVVWPDIDAVQGVRASRGFQRLLRFPLFWLGLAYGAVVTVQLLNPAWEFVNAPSGWYLQRIAYNAHLPHGVAHAPFEMENPARELLVETIAWVTLCALWAGITRRRTARLLIGTLAVNSAVLALVFMLQRLTGAKRLLWVWKVGVDYFVGGFIYKNHAGAYLNLMLGVCFALAAWHSARAQRHLRKSHPGFLFGFFAVMVVIAQLFTYARAATLLTLAFVAIVGTVWIARSWFSRERIMPAPVAAVLAALALGFIALCVVSLGTDKVWRKFGRLLHQDETVSVTYRQIAARATLDMARDDVVTGHGTGSFRFIFPLYQQRYPAIFVRQDKTSRRLYWEHAHNDYAELLAENGLLGVGFMLVLAGLTVAAVVRFRLVSHPAPLLAACGALPVLVHAAVDFPFHNPAVLVTTVSVVGLALRWSELDRGRLVPAPTR